MNMIAMNKLWGECDKCYVESTKRNIAVRFKEHYNKYIK